MENKALWHSGAGISVLLRRHWLWCVVIPLIALSRICWYGMLLPYKDTFSDCGDYIAFDTLAMLQGSPVNGRAPIYGMFLDFLELLFPAQYLSVAAFIQAAVSTVSLFVLAKLLYRIGVSSPWCELCVFFYSTTSAVLGWDACILTESFSLSWVIFFFYCTVLYIQQHRLRDGVLSILWAMALIFLRPQFLVYLALLLAFFVLKLIFPYDKAERKTLGKLLLLQLVCWAGIFAYCLVFQTHFGVFSMSNAMPRQNLMVCIDRGYYTDLEDGELASFVLEQLDQGGEPAIVCTEAIERFGNGRVDKATRQYFADHFDRYFWDTIDVMWQNSGEAFYGYAYNDALCYNSDAWGGFFDLYPYQKILFDNLTILHVLLASALEGIAMVVVWIKRRTMPWLHMALFSISVCTTYLTFFITNAQYMRTMISILPYFFCMAGLFLQMSSDYAARVRAAQPAHPQ